MSGNSLCKSLVDGRGQRRLAKPVQADRKATVAQITTLYNREMQKSLSERAAHKSLKQKKRNTAGYPD